MGYMAYSFAEAFRTDALIDHVRGTLGERHAQELLPGLPDTSPSRSARILPGQTDTPLAPLLDQLAQVQSYLPVGQFHGSNAWAVSGQLSASGKPLLANDPHIGFAVPAVWYEAHIRTPEHESTRLNSSHVRISYAVFCLKKKKPEEEQTSPEGSVDRTSRRVHHSH